MNCKGDGRRTNFETTVLVGNICTEDDMVELHTRFCDASIESPNQAN
jgi:hypothetical protein